MLEGADAVVGLNGATIGRFPWTRRYKSTLLWSRITPTRALARAVRELGEGAPAFVSASAVGYYGSAPGALLTEVSPRGETFLADLCGEWESAALGAGDHARVALLRTAPIVHPQGVLKPLHAADPLRRERADRARHAEVAVDLARRRGARHPARHRHGDRRSGEPDRTHARERQRPGLRTGGAHEPAVRAARAGVGAQARARRGCDRGAAHHRRRGACRQCWRLGLHVPPRDGRAGGGCRRARSGA